MARQPSLLLTSATPTCVRITVAGELDLHTQDDFQRLVLDQLDTASVVVDLSRLEFLSVCALSAMVACHAAALERNRGLSFESVPPQARRLLALSRLDTVLQISCMQHS